jgi:hypothetical protein
LIFDLTHMTDGELRRLQVLAGLAASASMMQARVLPILSSPVVFS